MSLNALVRLSEWLHAMGKGAMIAAVACLAMAGCSSSTPVAYQGLSSAALLHQVEDDEKPFQYSNADCRMGNYTKILIDPVTIYDGQDAQFGSVTAEDRQIIADYMTKTFPEILGKKIQIVQTANPATIRLHLTLTGIEESTPVLSALSHITPVGLIVNSGMQAAGKNGTQFGSVSYAAELWDSTTNTLLYAYVTKQTADALDVTASIGYLDAAKGGVRIGAKHLQQDLSNAGFPAVSR